LRKLKKSYDSDFISKDFGHLTSILGIEVDHNTEANTIDLSQPQKILDLAAEFGLTNSNPLSCPLPAGTNLPVVTHMSMKTAPSNIATW